MNLLGMLATTDAISPITWSNYVHIADFQPLIDGFLSMLPIVIAVCIPLLCIRKVFDFLKGNLYSA